VKRRTHSNESTATANKTKVSSNLFIVLNQSNNKETINFQFYYNNPNIMRNR
jgi:hypothetical protein